jgi:hypothetical protein
VSNRDAPVDEPTLKWYRRSGYDSVAYDRHLAVLSPDLPPTLRLLSVGGGSISLHDAWLIDARAADDTITLDIAAYDYARSGFNNAEVDLHLRVVYRAATMHGPTVDDLWLWRRSGVEILAGEFDRADDGRFIHRFLVFPESYDSMAVSFASAELVAVRLDGTRVSVVDQ